MSLNQLQTFVTKMDFSEFLKPIEGVNPTLQILLMTIVNVLCLSFRPSLLRTLLSLPVQIYILFGTPLPPGERYGPFWLANVWKLHFLFIYFDWIVLANPDKEQWHYVRKGALTGEKLKEKKDKGQLVPQTWWGRLKWATALNCTPRMVGWSSEVRGIPKGVERGYPKWKFIIRQLLFMGFYMVCADTIASWTASTPHGSYGDVTKVSQIKPPHIVGLYEVSFLQSSLVIWAQNFLAVCVLEVMNCQFSIIFVTLQLAEPDEFPPMFGPLSEISTVRNCWSRWWHLLMRRVCSAGGVFMSRDVLRLPKGSYGSNVVQVFVGFFISAVIHGCAAMLTTRNFETNREFEPYMLQAVMVLVEAIVHNAGQKYLGIRPNVFWRTMGYVSVFVWVGLSFRGHASLIIEKGSLVHDRGWDFFKMGPLSPPVLD